MSKFLSFAVTLSVATSLSGFGSSASTTTTTIHVPHSPCKEASDAECAKMLNERYMGFDENEPSSPLGVTLRGRPRFDENDPRWYYCTGKCYKGQPDCYTAGSLVNHKMMITPQSTIRLVMDLTVFVIIQPYAAEHLVTKCAYQYDGSAFEKNNGGCSNGAVADCDDPASAYQNRCPEDHTKYANEDECPSVMRAWCGTNPVPYPGTCSWRGPAWYSPTHAGAKPNFTKSDAVNEIRNMTRQRMQTQSFGERCASESCTEYWNEMTMDGRIIDELMADHPSKVIAAFGYRKGNGQSHGFATAFNDNLFKETGARVPVISIDLAAWIGTGSAGPFGTEDADEFLSAQLV